MLQLLILTDHVHLSLPIFLSLIVDLFGIDPAEADVRHLKELTGYPFNLSFEFEVRSLPACIDSLPLSQVLLDDAKVVIDASLAHVDALDHQRRLLADALHYASQVFHARIRTIFVLIGEETVPEVFI
jgi:hypothetical protein